jgi:hypothetical protein
VFDGFFYTSFYYFITHRDGFHQENIARQKMYRFLQCELLLTQKNKRLLLEGIDLFPIPFDYKSLDFDCYFSVKVVDIASRWYCTIISATGCQINTKSFRWDGISTAVELTNTEQNCCSCLGGCHRFVCLRIFKAQRCLELWVKHILDSSHTNSNFGFETALLSFK